jgi:hypothetical protein
MSNQKDWELCLVTWVSAITWNHSWHSYDTNWIIYQLHITMTAWAVVKVNMTCNAIFLKAEVNLITLTYSWSFLALLLKVRAESLFRGLCKCHPLLSFPSIKDSGELVTCNPLLRCKHVRKALLYEKRFYGTLIKIEFSFPSNWSCQGKSQSSARRSC